MAIQGRLRSYISRNRSRILEDMTQIHWRECHTKRFACERPFTADMLTIKL